MMWEIKNKTPFAAEGAFERDRNGCEVWCVAVRARFDVEPDGLVRLSEEPAWIRLAPEYADKEAQELLSDGDITPFKPASDILVRGMVQPVTPGIKSQRMSLRIGDREKKAVVLGERTLEVRDGKAELCFTG